MCESGTWFFILAEDIRLKVLGNRVFKKIFRPKREEEIWSWRKLGHVAVNGDMKNASNTLVVTVKGEDLVEYIDLDGGGGGGGIELK